MPKFNFKLKKYLNLKQQLETQKKMEYAAASNELEKSKLKKYSLIDEIDSQIQNFRTNITFKISSNKFSNINDYIELLKKRIIEQEKIILKNEKIVETKRLELVEAVKETKMIVKLEEKDYERYLKEENLHEQKIVDEIISYKYSQR
jgi:flagellar protein FliJ